MKKKIAILGSTGSIGKTLINLLKKEKKNIQIVFLSANKNYKVLLKQARFFKVKNLLISNKESFLKIKKNKNFKNIRIFNNFSSIDKIFKNKIDYTMSSISGLDGLDPTIKMIKYTKIIAIANKEAIIRGSNLINKELAKNNTKFIPVDSEHYSIYYALQNYVTDDVENIYLTASGGPLKNLSLKKFKYVKISDALKHPNWSMGKKISIDSATMMNKVFEIIEAHKIFKVPYSKLKILIHPKSYIHAIVKFKDGMIKIIAHDTNMRIPIFNTLNFMLKEKLKTEKINIKNLNNLNLSKVNYYKFPLVKIIEKLSNKDSLFETIIVSANDELVNLFLQKKIKFTQISEFLLKFIKLKEFNKYKHIKPKNIKDIIKLSNYVRFKIKNLSI